MVKYVGKLLSKYISENIIKSNVISINSAKPLANPQRYNFIDDGDLLVFRPLAPTILIYHKFRA